jgi:hypothetical protein
LKFTAGWWRPGLTVGIGRRSIKGLVWRFPFLRVIWAVTGFSFLIWVKIKMQNTTLNLVYKLDYDVFHLFWDALRKREEEKKKVGRAKSAY